MSLAAGCAAAAVLGVAVGALAPGPLTGLAAATVSLAAAHLALRIPASAASTPPPRIPRWDLPLHMALTAVLVVSLTAAATRLGPVVGGLLAALPVLASVLAAFTHTQCGGAPLGDLLRGMLGGMAGFVAFCALVALLAEPAGIAAAFAVSALAALAVQAATARGAAATRPAPAAATASAATAA